MMAVGGCGDRLEDCTIRCRFSKGCRVLTCNADKLQVGKATTTKKKVSWLVSSLFCCMVVVVVVEMELARLDPGEGD